MSTLGDFTKLGVGSLIVEQVEPHDVRLRWSYDERLHPRTNNVQHRRSCRLGAGFLDRGNHADGGDLGPAHHVPATCHRRRHRRTCQTAQAGPQVHLRRCHNVHGRRHLQTRRPCESSKVPDERDQDSPTHESDIAEPWRRFVGFAIDWTILVLASLAVVSVIGIDLGDENALRLPTSVRLVQGLVGAAYHVGFIASVGQTPGKMLIRTKVVSERTSRIPGLGSSALRWVVPGVFVFLPGVSVISVVIYGWLLFNTLRRGLHDKAARTVVVRVR